MKIAILSTDNREHHRNYAAAAPCFGTAPEALLAGFAQLGEAEVHVLSCTQQPMKSPAKVADNIWFHSLPVPRLGWMRTGYQGCIRAVRRKLKEIKPDIVHGQGTERDCAISAVFSGYPNVVTIHGNMAELARIFKYRPGSFGWLAARLENFTLPRTAGVFCNSAYTESLVRPRARRTWRVANAVRLPFFETPPCHPHPARAVLLCVGVISPRKRQLELLAVARELRAQGLDFEFRFIGQASLAGDYTAAFRQAIKPLEAEGCARYLGEVNGPQLIQALDEASAVVHFPSEESFGLVVVEALTRNLKLFGSRVGGIRDICEGVPSAELFEEQDWAGLTAGIANWVRAGFPRPTDGAGRMGTLYHPAVIARRHLEIYREVLSSRS